LTRSRSSAEERSTRRRWAIAAIALPVAAALIWGPKYYYGHVLGNLREVVPGLVYRSAQPSAAQLKRWQAQYGLKTVINLRGTETTDHADEKAATERLGLRLIDLAWPQNRLFDLADVRALHAALAQALGPYLVHCAEGIDRSGAVSVLLAMSLGGEDFRTAEAQLRSAYPGIDEANDWATGRFEEYEDYCAWKGIDPGGWTQFLKWLEGVDGSAAAPGRQGSTAQSRAS